MTISAEAGPEIDTNANRIQPIEKADAEQPITSTLLRLTARAQVIFSITEKHLLSASYGGGGKVFFKDDARRTDELVQQASLAWAIKLPLGVLSISSTYYDAFQRESLRDLRTGSGILSLTIQNKSSFILPQFHIGYRGLQYKPDQDYTFHGLVGGVRLSSALTSGKDEDLVDWNIALAYTAVFRHFNGKLKGLAKDCTVEGTHLAISCTEPKNSAREDNNHTINLSVRYLGNADFSLWYSFELNQSNSYGETYTRQVLGLKFTTRLFWEIYISVKGVLQFSEFKELLSPEHETGFVNIEDENRSRLLIQLSRDLFEYVSLSLRYTIYTNESISHKTLTESEEAAPSFFRQTLFIGLRFEYGQ